MKNLKVGYLSKAYKDAIREVDISLVGSFSNEHIQVEMIDMPYAYIQKKPLSVLYTFVLSLFCLPKLVLAYLKYDIVHFSSSTNYFWFYNIILSVIFQGKTKTVLTIHHVTLPKNKLQQSIYRRLLTTFDCIVVVSKATLNSVLRVVDFPQERVKVITNGIHQDYYKSDSSTAVTDQESYFLYVGDEYERKNLSTVLIAFSRINKLHPKIRFYKYGRVKSTFDSGVTDALLQQLDISRSVLLHRMEVTRDELRELYSRAICLVSPSLLEGFGLPVVEAVKCGCLPLVSSIEAYKDFDFPSFCYVDDFVSVDQWEERMKNAIALDKNERNKIVSTCEKAVQNFSWEKSAMKLADIYSQLC